MKYEVVSGGCAEWVRLMKARTAAMAVAAYVARVIAEKKPGRVKT